MKHYIVLKFLHHFVALAYILRHILYYILKLCLLPNLVFDNFALSTLILLSCINDKINC